MSKQYPGGLITKSPVTPSGPYTTDTASGIWTLDQQAYWAKLGQWPTAGNLPKDAQFNYVTMLLHGDGTNGAQNNTFLDSSTNNFTITRYGNATQGSFSPYGSNWSNYFDGSSSFSLSNNTALDMGTGNFTLEFWVFSTDASIDSQYRRFVVTGTNSTSAIQVGHIGSTSGIVAYTADDAALTITGTTNVLNTWAHIAVVRQSGTVKLYVNGVSEGTPITDSNSKTTSNFNIGRYPALSGYLKGNISNIRLVKGTAVYTSNFTPSTTPLTAISGTSLLTCQSNRFIDNSANAFTLTTNGTPSVQRFNPFGASTAYSTSVIGGSVYYDGSGDSLSTPASSANIPQSGDDYTVEAWIYLNSQGSVTSIYSGSTTGYFAWRSVGRFEFVSGALELRLTYTYPLSRWCHVAVTRQSGTVRMFVDGVLTSPTVSSGTVTGNTDVLITGSTYYFGSYTDSTSGPFYGYISNFRIVKGTAVYTATFTPPTAPLTAVTNTSILLNNTNAGIFDNAMMNDLETVGNAQISTSVVKYGTGSMAFDGTGDWLTSNAPANLNAFGTGNFTIEGWFYLNTTASQQVFLDFRAGPSDVAGALYADGANIAWYVSGANRISGGSLSTSTWYHIALCRSGTSTKLFLNGSQVGSTYTDTNNYICPSGRPYLGALSDGTGTLYLNGYMDDIRITKGYARYTATFTPPTAAFPNIGPT